MNDFLPLLGVWILGLIPETAGITYYWQLKEYRIDRMRDFFSTQKGRSLLLSPRNLIRVLLIIILIYNSYFPDRGTLIYAAIFLGIFLIIALYINFRGKKLFRPKKTVRMLLILFLVFALELSIFLYFSISAQTVLYLEILRPFFVSLIVLLTALPFKIAKVFIMKKAAKKIESLKNLKIVGITGSYGKTSTKQFLYDILKTEYNTVKTPKNINVDIGIAQTILKSVNNETEIFIAEMGAYKKGEIKSSTKVAKPHIGILTGINEQHLSLFGGIENTIKAKSELLSALPEDGTAIINAESENTVKALKFCKSKNIIKYGFKDNYDISASNIIQEPDGLIFKLRINGSVYDARAPLLGKHYVLNLLGAIYAAHKIGMNIEKIIENLKTLNTVEQSLELHKTATGVLILDDSYNANPDGFIAALKTAQELKENRIFLVTMGMVELGRESRELHQKVAKEIKKVCDEVIITSAEPFKYFKEEIQDAMLIEDPLKLISFLDSKLEKNDLVLFENRVNKKVLDHYKK